MSSRPLLPAVVPDCFNFIGWLICAPLNLEVGWWRSYFRSMKQLWVACLALCFLSPRFLAAQDDAAARAAAAADREAAEERYRRLNSAVEGLLAAQVDQQRRFEALNDEIRKLRAELSAKPEGNFVTRDEFTRLAETVKEIDRKRAADKEEILKEIERLGKSLTPLLNAPRRTPPSTPTEDRPEPRPNRGPDKKTESGSANQQGVWYTIEKGNTLNAIVAAHNDFYKSQGKKTSVKLIEEANPKLKATSMIIGQKIFIPLVSD